jgi:hypothetical protein
MTRTATLIPRQPVQAVVLARMSDGRHVQVGPPSNTEGARALHEILDFDQNGYERDRWGRMVRSGTPRTHSIKGEVVHFYRVREGSHEFGSVEQVPVGHVRKTHAKGR